MIKINVFSIIAISILTLLLSGCCCCSPPSSDISSISSPKSEQSPTSLPIQQETDSITQIDSSSDDNWKDYGIEVCMLNSDCRIGQFHLKNPNNGSFYWHKDIIAWLGQPSSTFSEIFSKAYIKPSRFGKTIKDVGEITYLKYGIGYIFRKDYNSNGMIVGIHIGEKLKSNSCYYVIFFDKIIKIGSDFSVFSDLCNDFNNDVYVKKSTSTYEIVSPNLGILFITSGNTIEESKVTDIIVSVSASEKLPIGINIE